MSPLSLLQELKRLDELLVVYLRELTPEQWQAQTAAPAWTVHDVALHLLDGNFRALSMLRDGFWTEAPTTDAYAGLVAYLNGLNASWLAGTRRLSPRVTTDLLAFSGPQYHELLEGLDPMAKATFSVAWAGEETSLNWFHIAREYTEKWHHQQQIRMATGDENTLLDEAYYRPYLATTVYALPYHYRDVPGQKGDVLQFVFRGESDKVWELVFGENEWQLSETISSTFVSQVVIPDRFAWQIFTKAMSREAASRVVSVSGNEAAGLHLLNLIAVMA